MLYNKLREIQRQRKLRYKMFEQYLYKMSNNDYDNSLSLIDYFNMVQIKKEIDLLNQKGNWIVKKIYGKV